MLATLTRGNRSNKPWQTRAAMVSYGGRSALSTIRSGECRNASKSPWGSQSAR